jgi:hypothetical protein
MAMIRFSASGLVQGVNHFRDPRASITCPKDHDAPLSGRKSVGSQGVIVQHAIHRTMPDRI